MPVYMAADTKAALGADRAKCASRSLFMDKFPEFPANDNDKESRRRFLESVILKSTLVFNREAFTAPNSTSFTAVLGGRLIVNQAGGVIENAGLCLDRHTGAPYIPGSALKGIAADAALDADARIEERALVFGFASGDCFSKNEWPELCARYPEMKKTKNLSGSVAFLPAYPAKNAPLDLDILTCHHPKYYSSPDPKAVALDNEQPNPQVFPVVKAGVEFLFQIALPSPNRLDGLKAKLGLPADFNPLARASEWLKTGLQDHGIGAKTAAGYGWFVMPGASGNTANATAVGSGTASIPDFNDRIFLNLLKLCDTRNRGQWGQLTSIMTRLSKPENREWLEKFWRETQGKDFKDLRNKEWYPKEAAQK